MTDNTNTFSTWKSQGEKSLGITEKEMRSFLGCWIYMGVVQLPALRDYWATATRVSQVADVMTFNRFQTIRSSLHFYDKTEEENLDPTDRYRKVRNLMDHIKSKCNSLMQETSFSIDEVMVPYKGKFAGILRQYIKSKPHKFGFKIFALAGTSGIVYDFLPYSGESTFNRTALSPEERSMGVCAKVVISLVKSIDYPEVSSVFFDNWFSSVNLMIYLKKELNLLATATIRSDRINKCPLLSDKQIKEQGRGSHDSKLHTEGVQVVKWLDNKIVHLVSTQCGVEPQGKASRFVRNEGGRVDFPAPRMIQLYNANMGGVDLNDMLVEINRLPIRGKRWYLSLMGYMIDLSLVNAFLLQKRHAKSLGIDQPVKCSKDFRLLVSQSLRSVTPPGRGRPSTSSSKKKKNVVKNPRGYRPPFEVRYDKMSHWPLLEASQARCKFCKTGYTKVKCSKCDMFLCLTKSKNCLLQFHSE